MLQQLLELMKLKKIIFYIIIVVLVSAGVKDAIHFLQPEAKYKTEVKAANSFPPKEATEIMMVYNAYNGIYPAAIDYVKKNVFPSTYPCNLCFLAFGNNGPKPAWSSFLETLPYKKTELHREDFRRQYLPKDMQLPVILLKQNNEVEVLVNGAALDSCKTLPELIALVKQKLAVVN